MRRRALLAANKPRGGGGKEITFYFDATPFGPFHELKALDGMTWGDWVDSEYNTIGIYSESYENYVAILCPPFGLSVASSDGWYIKGDNIIIEEYTYLVG